MKRFTITLGAAIVTATFATAASQAAIIAQYNFSAGSVFSTSSDTEANSTAGNVGFGTGAEGFGSNDSAKTENDGSFLAVKTTVAPTTTLDEAVTNNVFFSFTITPGVGKTINFDSLAGLVRRSAISSTRGWRLRSSLTGVTNLAQDSDITAARNSTTGAMEVMAPDSGTLTLSGVSQLQNVASLVTFTMYVNPNSTVLQGRVVDFDNIIVNGSVVVPEPASLALLGTGALALGRRRRRA